MVAGDPIITVKGLGYKIFTVAGWDVGVCYVETPVAPGWFGVDDVEAVEDVKHIADVPVIEVAANTYQRILIFSSDRRDLFG